MPTTRDGQRAISVGSTFPAPLQIFPNESLEISITLLGEAAVQREGEILDVLRREGARGMLGPDRLRFELEPLEGTSESLAGRLSSLLFLERRDRSLAAEEHALRLRTDSPLFLRVDGKRGKEPLLRPSFDDLLRASLRTIGRAFATFGPSELAEVDFRGLKELTRDVVCRQQHWEPFRQRHQSRRSRQQWNYRGVTGWAEYGDVAPEFFPWLLYAGAIGVGQHRVCGAGRWTLALEQSPRH